MLLMTKKLCNSIYILFYKSLALLTILFLASTSVFCCLRFKPGFGFSKTIVVESL